MCSTAARLLFTSSALGLILTSAWAARAETARTPSLDLTVAVYVFNSAEVPPGELSSAEALAARIFEKAGIKTTWVAGLTARRMDDQPTTEKWSRANLLLRILKSSTVRGKGLNAEAVGFCLSMETNEAVILFDAIRDRAADVNAGPATALGLSMAHEMGHLLLQSASHSLAGIMKPRWLAEDLAAAESGTFTFTREERMSMRSRIQRRTAIDIREEPPRKSSLSGGH